jgi:DNA-binding response OmpR family regulator
MSAVILLVEDEIAAAEMLSTFLEMNNFKVICFHTGSEALVELKSPGFEFDLAILDIMVPGVDGKQLCQYIRDHSEYAGKPVIFLTAKDAEQDEIMGLNLGADDYIPKPASLNLILAHVRTLLRRRVQEANQTVRIGDVEWNPRDGTVVIASQLIELTHSELKIVELLFRSPKRVFSRMDILEFITDDTKHVFDRTVDVHIKNLRLKLGKQGDVIKTYRGIGYGVNRDLIGSER